MFLPLPLSPSLTMLSKVFRLQAKKLAVNRKDNVCDQEPISSVATPLLFWKPNFCSHFTHNGLSMHFITMLNEAGLSVPFS